MAFDSFNEYKDTCTEKITPYYTTTRPLIVETIKNDYLLPKYLITGLMHLKESTIFLYARGKISYNI